VLRNLYAPKYCLLAPVRMIAAFAVGVGVLACQPVDEAGKTPSHSNALASMDLLATSLNGAIESKHNKAVAASFENPRATPSTQPLQTEPEKRFEQWTLSAMVRNDKADWWWLQQTVQRVAVNPSHHTSESAWAFRDVMLQHYTEYDFSAGSAIHSVDAQRRSLSLADVTDNGLHINDVEVLLSSRAGPGMGASCETQLSLLHAASTLQVEWNLQHCPERFDASGTVFSENFTPTVLATLKAEEALTGIGWVSHAYGRVPELTGAVILDALHTLLPDGRELHITQSRRRSGRGPVTVAARVQSQANVITLTDVVWSETRSDDEIFPSEITIEIPSLSVELNVAIPKSLSESLTASAQKSPAAQMFASSVGVEHGVLVSLVKTEDIESAGTATKLPGKVSLHPWPSQAL